MGLRDELLAIDDLRTKEVKVPGWKTSVTVRELGLQEAMTAFADAKPNDAGEITFKHADIARIVAFGVIDPESGDRAFTDADIPVLARKSKKALMFLFNQIMQLSGSVEDEVKN